MRDFIKIVIEKLELTKNSGGWQLVISNKENGLRMSVGMQNK